MSQEDHMSLIERDELIERLIEADEALFDSGEGVSHRQSAEAALRVVEDYINQRLRRAKEALTVLQAEAIRDPAPHSSAWLVPDGAMDLVRAVLEGQ